MKVVCNRTTLHGFTLVEMIVVLALLGLLVALTAPSIGRQLTTRSQQAELDTVVAEIKALPVTALLEGRILKTTNLLVGPISEPIRIPASWQVAFEPPLIVTPVPACTASTITIKQTDQLQLQAVFFVRGGTCQLEAYSANFAAP
jgi:general secretion pathway protein G